MKVNIGDGKNVLSEREVKLYRTLFLFAGVITPIFAFLWTNFHSNLKIINLVATILSVYYISIFLITFKNEYIKQRMHYFLYTSYYFVSVFVVYLGYINQFTEGYSLLILVVVFYIILTFSKMKDLLYYLITVLLLIIGTLYMYQLQTPSTDYIIIGASFIVFSVIAVFNLHIRFWYQQALKESYEDYQRMLGSLPDGIIVYENKKIVYANPSIMKLLDSKEKIIGKSILDFIDISEHKEIDTEFEPMIKRGKTDFYERKLLLSNNKLLELEIANIVTTYKGKQVVMSVLKDISSRKSMERELIEAESKFRSLVEGALVGVYIYQEGKIVYANPYMEDLYGYSRQEISNMELLDLIHSEDKNFALEEIRKLNEGAKEVLVEIRTIKKDGSTVYVQVQGSVTVYKGAPALTGTFIDITARKETESKMQYMAYHDSLTNLPNRYILSDYIKHAIEGSRHNGLLVSVMFVDLDRFKIINDTMGHAFGDLVLKQAADRLKDCIRKCDFLARYGGDEFIIVLRDISRDEIDAVAKRIITKFSNSFNINKKNFYLSPSIGISISPWDSDNAETLIKHADTAMYLAKGDGRNTYRFYDYNDANLGKAEKSNPVDN